MLLLCKEVHHLFFIALITFISKLSSNFIHSINTSHYKHLNKDKIRNIKCILSYIFKSTEMAMRNTILHETSLFYTEVYQ